ncbi:hypothetical protein [Lentzea xinjiangensis]|nr:hypothetical protein [Lentzea xinjiangensis]
MKQIPFTLRTVGGASIEHRTQVSTWARWSMVGCSRSLTALQQR